MKIAVAASPEVAIPTLDWLLGSTHNLDLIISRPDSAIGRGRELTPTPVSVWANQHDIELYKPAKAKDFDERLRDYDLVITIGYGLILPQYLLDQPKYGFINLHFSLLPQLRGAAPAQRAIIDGLKVTGITVFKLDAGMDTGPIYLQRKYEIPQGLTAGELLEELSLLGPESISETLELITSGTQPTPQAAEGSSLAAKLSKDEARINWQDDAQINVNKIHGFAPNPSATTIFRGQSLKISRARTASQTLPIGQIQFSDNQVLVGTGSLAIELLEVTPAGKRSMAAVAWANGARLNPGESFE